MKPNTKKPKFSRPYKGFYIGEDEVLRYVQLPPLPICRKCGTVVLALPPKELQYPARIYCPVCKAFVMVRKEAIRA